MPWTIRALLALACLPLSFASAQGTRTPAKADVPVTKVVLFSSGVGYFEHSGLVHGDGTSELRVRTSQINDILKSIVLQDQDGGRVGAITYASQDPLVKTLRSFQVDITQNPSQADLLNQLRGARVTVAANGATLTGTIVGVEMRRKAADKGEPVQVPVLNLLSGATIRAVELPSVTSLSLDDPQLEEELARALSTLVQARDQDRKTVAINFHGMGDRRVRMGYVVETPIWKTSYRLLLEDNGRSGKLQGWAIVENQTESDWSNVSLALVSGRPISFQMDLYQPLYATRPTVVPEEFEGLHPQVYAGGTLAAAERVRMSPASAPRTQAADSFARRLASSPMQLQEVVVTSASPMDIASSVQALGDAKKLGALFQYSVGNVTLARQKSAMLPIITDSVHLERVSIYNTSVLATNPLNGVWFRNTTGKHLLQGPVTVLEKGTYAGDARIDDVPPGETRLLSYGIDLDMTVDAERTGSTSSVVSARIEKGSLIISRRMVSTREYAADNRSAKDKMLLIEHQTQGWKLVETQAPFETTPTLYRFKGNAAAHKVTALTVKEEYVRSETMALVPMDLGPLAAYSRMGEIPSTVREGLARAIRLKGDVADLDRQVTTATQRVAEITAEQNRIRENMKTVAPSGTYYDRLLTKLNDQESQIETLQADRAMLVAKRDAARHVLEDYLSGLTLQ